jgi:restriction system protein
LKYFDRGLEIVSETVGVRIASQGDVNLQAATQHLIAEFGLTPEQATKKLSSGQAVIYNRTGWAKTELAKAGLLWQPRRGVFGASDAGRQLLGENPSAISRAFLIQRYPEFLKYLQPGAPDSETTADTSTSATQPATVAATARTPDEEIEAGSAALYHSLELDLLAKVR